MRRDVAAPAIPFRLSPHNRAAAGPAPGPLFPFPLPLRLPPGGRARAAMEEPLALHPVKLYVYDLSKGMARRLSPLMLGKSAAGAPAPVPARPTQRLVSPHRPPRPGHAAPGKAAGIRPGGGLLSLHPRPGIALPRGRAALGGGGGGQGAGAGVAGVGAWLGARCLGAARGLAAASLPPSGVVGKASSGEDGPASLPPAALCRLVGVVY